MWSRIGLGCGDAALLRRGRRELLGEVAGVATNSRGHLFIYTRTGNPSAMVGASRIITHGGSRLFQFDQNGKFLEQWTDFTSKPLLAAACPIDWPQVC